MDLFIQKLDSFNPTFSNSDTSYANSNTQVEIINELIQNGYFKIEINSQEDTLMIINETWDPGWKVLINNIEEEILIANRAFMGVMIEKGYNSIEIFYENFNRNRVPKAFKSFLNQ